MINPTATAAYDRYIEYTVFPEILDTDLRVGPVFRRAIPFYFGFAVSLQ
jgi:hypothetical protein